MTKALDFTNTIVFSRMGISGVDLFLYCETDIDVIIDQVRPCGCCCCCSRCVALDFVVTAACSTVAFGVFFLPVE